MGDGNIAIFRSYVMVNITKICQIMNGSFTTYHELK